jgi:hypothetical protein
MRVARSLTLLVAGLLVASTMAVSAAPTEAAGPIRARHAEKYAMKLLDCTRTGGWVRADGSCRGYGSGRFSARRKPLKRSWGISNKVAYPWAKALAKANECGHVLPGKPRLPQRLAAKGFGSGGYGENVGCGWGYTARQAVLVTHRGMQAEKSDDGGHWRNMKDRDWKRVGVGVAKINGRVMVVYDFYTEAVK